MKRGLFLLVMLLGALLAGAAAADMTFSVETDATVSQVAIFNEQGELKSEVAAVEETQNGRRWTLRVFSSKGSGTLYYKDAAGNWLRQGLAFDLGGETGGGQAAPAPAQAPAWETRSFATTPIALRWIPDEQRHQSRSGPGRAYHGAGAYRHYKLRSVDALFVENGYVYVDQTYSTVARRRLYYAASLVDSSLRGVPEVTLSGTPATLLQQSLPYFGPGKHYDEWDEALLPKGTALTVFFEENGWVFAEFYANDKLGAVRAWLPAGDVQGK